MRPFVIAVLAALSLVMILPAARAADKLGIVLMHGKQGSPDRNIANIASALSAEGYLVARPEMCWSKRRIYDKPYADCLAELDKVIEGLRADGATAIVIAGHSLGGNGAVGYAATHTGIKGLVLLAAAHHPERIANRPEVAESLAKARAMVADGHGQEHANFGDVNSGWTLNVSCTAETYVSFMDPAGAASIPVSMAHVQVPVLWVSGDRDKSQTSAAAILARAAPDPLSRHVTVAADHPDTPDAAIDTVLPWLKELAER